MDNKITKKRLSDFLAYEWIIMIVIAVVAIIGWELIFTVSSVRITVGQSYKYFYDQYIYSDTAKDLYKVISGNKTFSYDIKKLDYEILTEDYNVLSMRLSVNEGDAMFTGSNYSDNNTNRVNDVIDNFSVYDYYGLLTDAKDYLKGFLKSGETDMLNYQNLDQSKIENAFNERAKKRVYKNDLKAGKISVNDEFKRIEKLCKEVSDFEYLLESKGETDLFYRYTRYQQMARTASEKDKSNVEDSLNKEKENGGENLIYGLNLIGLTGGAENPSKYFKNQALEKPTAKFVVLVIFNFKKEQPDLQYESISFINTIVRTCSDFYSGR